MLACLLRPILRLAPLGLLTSAFLATQRLLTALAVLSRFLLILLGLLRILAISAGLLLVRLGVVDGSIPLLIFARSLLLRLSLGRVHGEELLVIVAEAGEALHDRLIFLFLD